MAAFLNTYNSIAAIILQGFEQFFYCLGIKIAKNPWKTILFCWIFVLLSLVGFVRFHQEKNPLKLWIPPDSNFYRDTVWLMENFKTAIRPQITLITAPNVLTAEVLTQAVKIRHKVVNTETDDNVRWPHVCFKVPIIEFKFFENFDPSLMINTDLYCTVLENMKMDCLEMNIVDLWKYDEETISQLSQQEILDKINTVTVSPVSGHAMNYTKFLGNIKRNATNHIVSAEALITFWMINVNFEDVDMDVVGNDAGTADWASESSLQWEEAFLKTMEEVSKNISAINVYYEASRSFGDISGATMFQDIDKLMIGIALMVIYVQLVLSNFNWLECRSILSALGLLCVGMAFISACGLCSLVGISYGPVHTSLPFLLMGLGVDDMFVIMASWNQLENTEKLPLHEKIGQTLRHAGLSISLTSFTDALAFLIGAFTILPSLKSFCLYAAIGVFLTFVMVVTFFVACFSLDQRRIQENRDALLFCYRHENYKPPECSRRQYSSTIFQTIYSDVILTKPGKAIVILATLCATAFSLESTLRLEQRFDLHWFIPDHTYLHGYIEQRNKYFPQMGYEGLIFFGRLNYSQEFMNIHEIVLKLENRSDIVNNINAWTTPFIKYVENLKSDFDPYTMSNDEWNDYISKFLYSPKGARFQPYFRFERDLICGQPAPPVIISSFEFRFNLFRGPEESLPAKHAVEDIVRNNNFTSGDRFATVWAKAFSTWVTDEVIHIEVIRNLLLALGCVMFCTFVLITNIQMCFWIFVCVLLTMVNVCGFMQRWGLTIDLVACIGLELGIGLCVDFATHIGHTFLVSVQTSRKTRVIATVSHIGAAIFYGGCSTLLALSMLRFSDAYVFQSFFKIFFLVIVFGLFHGLVLLPVILSMIGPPIYNHLREKELVSTFDHQPEETRPAEESINLKEDTL